MLSQLPLTEVFPGLAIEFGMDGQLICLTTTTFSANTIDSFVGAVRQIEENQPVDKTLYYYFDFSRNFAAFLTPYGRSKLDEFMKGRSDKSAFWAIVLPERFAGVISNVISRQLTDKGLMTRVFNTREKAMQWLEQMLNKANA